MIRDFNFWLPVAAALATAFLLTFAVTPLVKSFAFTIGAIDIPKDERRMHKVPIPRIGGLGIIFGFLVAVLLFSEINEEMRGVLIGLVVILVLGLVDDIKPLPALFKFIVQIAAAMIPIMSGLRIERLANPNIFDPAPYINLGVMSIPVTLIWIVGITNSVNFIDGLDGLAVGVSTISAVSILTIAILKSEAAVAIATAALAGACIGFIPYNMNPAKIFMGDVGATSIGYLFATLSIIGLFKFYAVVTFAVPLLILAIPLFDFLFAIIRRLLAGKNPMQADRGHVHHRLIDMGFNQKQAVAIMYTMSGILGMTAVLLTVSGALKAILFVLAVLAAVAAGTEIMHLRNLSKDFAAKKDKENGVDHTNEAGDGR